MRRTDLPWLPGGKRKCTQARKDGLAHNFSFHQENKGEYSVNIGPVAQVIIDIYLTDPV